MTGSKQTSHVHDEGDDAVDHPETAQVGVTADQDAVRAAK
jgi:hypothetical protein